MKRFQFALIPALVLCSASMSKTMGSAITQDEALKACGSITVKK